MAETWKGRHCGFDSLMYFAYIQSKKVDRGQERPPGTDCSEDPGKHSCRLLLISSRSFTVHMSYLSLAAQAV